MARLIRKTVILAKVETTSGTDAVPTGALNAMQVSDLSITPLDANNIELPYIRAFFGAGESLVGSASVKCSFSVNLAGAGTAATDTDTTVTLTESCLSQMMNIPATCEGGTHSNPFKNPIINLPKHILHGNSSK